MDFNYSSLLNYYQEQNFNPVPINVEEKSLWDDHISKRQNLYQRHLMIPVPFFNNRSIIEFGCNSGENALYLASLEAKLTLVEPNDQVLSRLKSGFKKFGFERRIKALVNKDIAGFESDTFYDVIIAECFLNQLSNGEEMFLKICKFLKPGGLGIISFDDRYGSFLEVVRQLVLKRICQLKDVNGPYSEDSLNLAKSLYGADFKKINASRPFKAWWKDVLVSPFVSWTYLWTYQQFISLLNKAGCEFYSSSPKWSSFDHFSWYKNVPSTKNRHQQLLEDWYKFFPFFLSGIPCFREEVKSATSDIVEGVSKLMKMISEYIDNKVSINTLLYPRELDNYLANNKKTELIRFNTEIKTIFNGLKSDNIDEIISSYHNAEYVRTLWGTPCHYICFMKA